MLAPEHIQGITLLGGEPFEPENQQPILQLLRAIKKAYPNKSIWAFSGYLFDKDILAGRLGPWDVTREYIGYLDVLVDGPFDQSKRDTTLSFRGSTNQNIYKIFKVFDDNIWYIGPIKDSVFKNNTYIK